VLPEIHVDGAFKPLYRARNFTTCNLRRHVGFQERDVPAQGLLTYIPAPSDPGANGAGTDECALHDASPETAVVAEMIQWIEREGRL